MNDCVNGDIRDLLPELVNGTLQAEDVLRVQDHLRRCADCAAEVELLQTARAAMRLAPAMDTARIAAAVQASSAQRLAARRVPARVARIASLSLIVILAVIALWPTPDNTIVEPAPRVAGSPAETARPIVEQTPVVEPRAVRAPTQLALGGDMSGLEEDELLTLLEEVSALEAMPGEEPVSLAIEPVMPVDEEGVR